MTLKSELEALERQMRESHDKLTALSEQAVQGRKSMVYARDLLRRALAEVESLNREADRE